MDSLNRTSEECEDMEKIEITEQQLKAATMLVSGIRATDVAASLGISKQSISMWKARPQFQRVIESLQIEQVEDMRGALRALRDTAIECLTGILTDATVPAAVRLKGALAVIDKIDAHDPRLRPLPADAPTVQRQTALDDDALVWDLIGQARAREKAEPPKIGH